MKALTRKRPIPEGLIAKFDSLVASKSASCRSFMIARTMVEVYSGLSGLSESGVKRPSIFTAGGNPALKKRSEAFLASITRNSSCTKLLACSRSMVCTPL